MAEEYTDPETIEEAIRQRAIDGVKKTSDEFGREVEYMPIGEMKEAGDIGSGEAAKKKPHRGVMFTKLIPPGTG